MPSVLGSDSEEPSIGQNIILVATWNCPYAQRTWIALNEKQVPYELVLIDLQDKPKWLLKYNPWGRVPTLLWRNTGAGAVESIFESIVTTEYIDDGFDGPSLLPAESLRKAKARLLLDQFNVRVGSPFGKLLSAQDQRSRQEAVVLLTEALPWLEAQLNPQGPYILGSEFSLVDIAIIPVWIRIETLSKVLGFPMPSGLPRLQQWAVTTKMRNSVVASFLPPASDKCYYDQLAQSVQGRIAASGFSCLFI